jgi:D-threonate/D-erythronate kinase
MGRVAILADDLTGALDAAAPFASERESVTVAWRKPSLIGRTAFAFDTESRGKAAGDALAEVLACLPRLREADISFKKVDSLMRGNSLAELAACAASGAFRSMIIAPAFPERGRITRGGHQLGVAEGGVPEVDVDVAGALAERSVAVSVVRRGGNLPDQGVAVCDAETRDDLLRLAHQASVAASPILWCGAAGLARALSTATTISSAQLQGRRLIVVGSRHAVSKAQSSRLSEEMSALAVVAGPGGVAASMQVVQETLGAGGSSALVFALPPLDPPAAERVFRTAFARLARIAPPEVLVVSGGDTLFRLCDELAAESLEAIGEWSPGVAVARIVGGAWDGVTLISKSGAFGDPDLLVGILENREHPR